jgi:hypothetical protein
LISRSHLFLLNTLTPSGYCMYHQVQFSKNIRSAHAVYLRVFYGPQNKQRLFLYTTLTDWFSEPRLRGFTARYEQDFQIKLKLMSVLKGKIRNKDNYKLQCRHWPLDYFYYLQSIKACSLSIKINLISVIWSPLLLH